MHTEKHVLFKKSLQNMGLPQWAWIKKAVHGVETHQLSSKEKISCKEDHADSLLRYERIHNDWFPWWETDSHQVLFMYYLNLDKHALLPILRTPYL